MNAFSRAKVCKMRGPPVRIVQSYGGKNVRLQECALIRVFPHGALQSLNSLPINCQLLL